MYEYFYAILKSKKKLLKKKIFNTTLVFFACDARKKAPKLCLAIITLKEEI